MISEKKRRFLDAPLLVIFVLLFSFLESVASEDFIFSEAFVGLEGGNVYPVGSVQEAVEQSFYGQAEFRYRYFDATYGLVQFGYAYFKTHSDFKLYPGVHQFHGRMGLDHSFPVIHPILLGFGFSCVWTRADTKVDKLDNSPGSSLEDNESEFGVFLNLNLPVFKNESYVVGVNAYMEQIWTLPARSHMFWMGVYLQRRLW